MGPNVWVTDPATGRPMLTARRSCRSCGSSTTTRDQDGDVVRIHRPHCTNRED